MANSFASLIPSIIGKGAKVLREQAIFPKYVYTDFGSEVAQKGQVITIPVSGSKSTSAVTPGAVPPTPSSTTTTSKSITLSNWKKADFHLTEKEAAEILANQNFIPLEMEECFRAIANDIDSSVSALYTDIYGYAGTAATTPFGTPGIKDATSVYTQLNQQLAPMDNRALILDPSAYGAAMNLPEFYYLNRGNASMQDNGKIGSARGFAWDVTTTVPTHTSAAVGNGAMTANGVNTIGNTTLSIAKAVGASWSAVKGDIIFIAYGGSIGTRSHVITADVTVVHNANTNVTIYPGLYKATSGGETITKADTHVVNLGIQKGAFGLAMRALPSSIEGGFSTMPNGTATQVYTDPVSGLTFRVDMIPGYHQTSFEVSALWGCTTIRPELACRLAG